MPTRLLFHTPGIECPYAELYRYRLSFARYAIAVVQCFYSVGSLSLAGAPYLSMARLQSVTACKLETL